MASVLELRAQAEELLKKAAEQEEADKVKLFDSILKKLIDSGQTVAALMEYENPKKKKGSVAPKKYRGPNGEEWAGIGRHPGWFDQAIASGKTEESMLIK